MVNDWLGEYLFFYYVVMVNFEINYLVFNGFWIVDVCVVGGGYMGLFVVFYLVVVGFDVVVFEVNCVGWGVFGCNGG